jgi:transcriptional regulator with XRE-family HTH domain
LRSRWLGAKLQELRLAAGLRSLNAAAAKAGRSTASLSRIENGIVLLPPRDLPPILDAYGVTDQRLRERLHVAAVEIQQERRGWWLDHDNALSPTHRDLLCLEATATDIMTYETHFVPGLLQTPAYARTAAWAAWTSPTEAIAAFVQIRMGRKRILAKEEERPRFRAVISEGVLRHPLGGAAVFREQLAELVCQMAAGTVELRVLCFGEQAHPGLAGAFTVLRLPSIDVTHVEMMNSDAYIEDEIAVARYVRAFERLWSLALDERESEALIGETASML